MIACMKLSSLAVTTIIAEDGEPFAFTCNVSSCSCNELGPEEAAALSWGLTALTNLKSIEIRCGRGKGDNGAEAIRGFYYV